MADELEQVVAELRAVKTVLMMGGFDLLGNSTILRHARGVTATVQPIQQHPQPAPSEET